MKIEIQVAIGASDITFGVRVQFRIRWKVVLGFQKPVREKWCKCARLIR